METVVQPVRRRPKDRKQQILDQAVGLFIDRGFHSVKLEDIAEAAGVTARALYRHYDNKQALLAEAIRTGQDQYQSARRLTDGESELAPRPLSVDLPDLIAAAVASRALTVLWQREARYLNEGDRAQVRRRINAIVAGMRESVLLEVPGLSPPHSELRAWAVSSTLTSLGRHNLTLPAEDLKTLLYQACMAAARTPPPPDCNRSGRARSRTCCSPATRHCWLPVRGCFARRGIPRSAPARSPRVRASPGRDCIAPSRPSRRSWTPSSGGLTNGAAWKPSVRCVWNLKRHNASVDLSRGMSGSA